MSNKIKVISDKIDVGDSYINPLTLSKWKNDQNKPFYVTEYYFNKVRE